VEVLALVLVVVGALNWGLVGVAKLDLVYEIFGGFADGVIQRIVYILVGVAGLLVLVRLPAYLGKK
jgi:uncharacterized membrane protein YuzA (DUF378 family)